MTQNFTVPEGATPLSPEEQEGLLYEHIDTREELNELESINIHAALIWLDVYTGEDLLSFDFLKELHIKMLGEVWSWAGTFRTRELNIDCAPNEIWTNLHNLFEDCKYWIENETYSSLEISARLHHQLVKIHPFPNGNGRHARIFTNYIRIKLLQVDPLTWSNLDLNQQNDERREYVSALQAADRRNYNPLLEYLLNKVN